MPTSLDNVLLSVDYTGDASGGGEWATALVKSGSGGTVTSRNENREDYLSRYDISFGMLEPVRRRNLRNFCILRRGMARGFRFLPPDDSEFIDEPVGVLNESTAEIDLLETTDGETDTFFLIRHFEDAVTSYTRWIVCPSPLDDLSIEIYDESDLESPEVLGTFPGGYIYTETGERLPRSRAIELETFGRVHLYYGAGRMIFDNPLPEGKIVRISGRFHLPVAFGEDLQKFSVDDGSLAELKVSLEEILPIELGLSPEIELTGDITAPEVTLEFV